MCNVMIVSSDEGGNGFDGSERKCVHDYQSNTRMPHKPALNFKEQNQQNVRFTTSFMSGFAHDESKVPVTILTGFLGAGKTTLLNHILTDMHGMTFAIIENEFGEVGVDDAILKRKSDEDIIEMNNGCICCTVRGDLSRIVQQILSRKDKKFDGIIIETTGLADPAPVAQTFFIDESVGSLCQLGWYYYCCGYKTYSATSTRRKTRRC